MSSLHVTIALVVLAAAAPPRETAGRRYRGEAHAIWSRQREPGKAQNSAVGRLDERAFRERAAAVAEELAAELRDPTLTAREKSDALADLKEIGPLAAGAAPTLIAVLHDHDRAETEFTRVSYFCEVTRALATVAPSDPAVIRALADALEREPAGRGACHRCQCALEALAVAGPAARTIAGPVLERLARQPSRVPYQRLEQAVDAVGGASSMVPSLLARAGNPGVSIDDRAASLRTLAKQFDALSAAEKDAVRVEAEKRLLDEFWEIRVAAAELLGLAGPRSVARLAQGLDDPRYQVRAAAARALARLGPAASPTQGRLVAALDPFLGTAEAAAEALVAIGPSARPEVAAAARTAPRHLRPVLEAASRALEVGTVQPVRDALAASYTHPGGAATYADVEVIEAGQGKAYAPHGYRIQARIRGGVYTPGGPPPPAVDETLTVDDAPNALFAALVGRRAGDRLRLRLSPETIPDPYSGFPTPRPSRIAQFPVGSGAEFEVDVLRVCEPVVWTLFRGGGILGPIRFETHCR